MTGGGSVDRAAVFDALRRVYDPCSQAWGRPLSLLDLGLVRAVDTRPDGRVAVTVSLTAPYCMAINVLMQSVEERVGELAGVTGVDVEIDTETPWDPSLMTAAGRAWLAERRAADRGRPVLVPLLPPEPVGAR